MSWINGYIHSKQLWIIYAYPYFGLWTLCSYPYYRALNCVYQYKIYPYWTMCPYPHCCTLNNVFISLLHNFELCLVLLSCMCTWYVLILHFDPWVHIIIAGLWVMCSYPFFAELWTMFLYPHCRTLNQRSERLFARLWGSWLILTEHIYRYDCPYSSNTTSKEKCCVSSLTTKSKQTMPVILINVKIYVTLKIFMPFKRGDIIDFVHQMVYNVERIVFQENWHFNLEFVMAATLYLFYNVFEGWGYSTGSLMLEDRNCNGS